MSWFLKRVRRIFIIKKKNPCNGFILCCLYDSFSQPEVMSEFKKETHDNGDDVLWVHN